jgi:hypothetical protein
MIPRGERIDIYRRALLPNWRRPRPLDAAHRAAKVDRETTDLR